jgi:hypothetical protein
MIPRAQNMKNGPDALDPAENEYGRAKQKNGTRRPWCRRKRVRAQKTSKRDTTLSVPPKMSTDLQNMKKERDALVTTENESKRAKHENGT